MVHILRPRLQLLPFLLLLSFLTSLLLVSCRTVTWIAEGEGSLQDAANWDTRDVPTAEDDAVISLPSLPLAASPYPSSLLLSPSFVPSSLDDVDDSVILTLSAPLTLASLSLNGSLSLIVDQPLSIDATLTISASSIVRVRNAELTVSSVLCSGLLALELGALSSSAVDASLASAALGSVKVDVGGLLLTSGPGGANRVRRFDVDVGGGLVAISAPLLLDHSVVIVRDGGVAALASELVSVEGTDAVSAIVNRGTLIVTGDMKQLLVVPTRNDDGGEVRLSSSSSLSLLSPFASSGRLVLSQRHHLVTTAPVQLSSTSSVELKDAAVWHVQADAVVNRGVIASEEGREGVGGGGTLSLSATFNNSGTMRVSRMVMREGSVWGVDEGSVNAIAALTMSGGHIAGRGSVDVFSGRVTGASPAPKVLDGVDLSIVGSFVQESGSVLMLRDGAQVTVKEDATMTMEGGATIRADDDRSVLTVLGVLAVDSTAQRRADDDEVAEIPPTSIALPLTCRGNLSLTGAGTTVLQRTTLIAHLTSQGSPTLALQSGADGTSYTFYDTVDLTSHGSTLILQNANASFTSASPPRIDFLDVRDGRVYLAAGIVARTCRVGSAQSPGIVEGDGRMDVSELRFEAGELRLPAVSVRGGWLVERSSAKLLQVGNVTLLPGSSSRFTASELTVSAGTFIAVQPSASLKLGTAVTLYTTNRTVDGNADRREATLHVEDGALLHLEGSGHGASSLWADLILDGRVVVNNTGNGLFSVALRGVSSAAASSIEVSSSTSLLLGCPADYPMDCHYGRVDGKGSVVVTLGRHLFPSPVSVASLSVAGGAVRLMAPVSLGALHVAVGELVLDAALNVSRFAWTGGALRGYPLLGSSVLVQSDGRAFLASNDTLTLDGVALLIACPLQWTSGDLMMRNAAVLSVKEGGELRLAAGEAELRVVSDASTARIENEGAATILSPLVVHVPVINTGRLVIANATTVTLHADYVQAAASSSLHVEAGSVLVKRNGDLLVVQGSVSIDGKVQGDAEVGGRLIVGGEQSIGSLDGDLVLTPAATVVLMKAGRPLSVNGSVLAAGSVVVEDGAPAGEYAVLAALSTVGSFAAASHHQLSYAGGVVTVRTSAVSDSSDDHRSSVLSSAPTLYLPFVRVPDSLSSSLASIAVYHGAGGGVCASADGKGRGTLGWSAPTTAVVLVVLASLLFLSTGVALCLGYKLWSERRRHVTTQVSVAEDVPQRMGEEAAAPSGDGERQRQRGQDMAVAYL